MEIPKSGIKELQRKVLTDILDLVPTHSAAHGFRKGYSITSNAIPHCGKQIVLHFDLRDFFPSVSAARIFRIYQTLGYPERVAQLLTGLCTTSLPTEVWQMRPHPRHDGSDHSIWQRLRFRHLPQGAPTSPAIANLSAWRLDCRLAKLAASLEADYTRYADDLTISGGSFLASQADRVKDLVAVIVLEEGFTLNYRKTRIMKQGVRQRVAGVIVNVKPNLLRSNFDRLKAILTNCNRHGAASQNREKHHDFQAHLRGRVSQAAAVNPTRGQKLWELFDKIVWKSALAVDTEVKTNQESKAGHNSDSQSNGTS